MTRTAVRGSAEWVALLIAVTAPRDASRGNIDVFFPLGEARAVHAPPGWKFCIDRPVADFFVANYRRCIPVRNSKFSALSE
ncbi:MAG: hypothetical protein M0Z84_11985 [Gammaproteobacteria bacterium]|nr:hypothetical protein [Rhodospirillales bacterium]MDA8364503.1 hypothetical protein [Gammaproteobacteria bacterium]